MLKKNKIIFCIIALLGLFLSSCDVSEKQTADKTKTVDFAGDWYITLKKQDGTPFTPAISNEIHSTYNTSANDDSMWIDDHFHGYEIKCKFLINTETGTFVADDSPNFYDLDANNQPKSTVKITDGKFIKGGGLSKGNHIVDKIIFRAHFSYDPIGTDVLFEGHKRTGFLEDEY